jgi:hypothetical protein
MGICSLDVWNESTIISSKLSSRGVELASRREVAVPRERL